MQFKLLSALSLPLQRQLQWLWWSDHSNGFVVGDDRSAYLLGTSAPSAGVPIALANYDGFAGESWHGFNFLKRSEYDASGQPVEDLIRTLVFGPDYGLYIRHSPSGLILGLRGGSMQLLRHEGDRLISVEKTKTRGRAALAFAAHSSEPMITYGDNYGTFHTHRFSETGFGKASKFAEKERKASRLEFAQSGQTLIIGGMGYLAAYLNNGGKFTPAHEVSIAVRDFVCLNEGALIFVNQGMQGIAVYRHDQNGFQLAGSVPSAGAVNQIATSKCGRYLAATRQESAEVCVYAVIE